jgi:5-methyltetrahydropteroyltriglutamate--homocysteine methyltransferase
MKRSEGRIRTTHAGRLPTPPGCEGLPMRLFRGEKVEPAVINAGIDHVIGKQLELGIDCIGDGEFWKVRTFAYLSRYFTGIETRPLKPDEPASTRVFTRERDEFVQFYKDLDATGTIFHVPGEKPMPAERERAIVTGPIKFKGGAALAQELDTFKAAIGRAGRAVDETFFCVIAPGWLDHFIFNEHYKTDEDYVFALADALREEYLAVVKAGFVLQIDDPGLPDWWDMIKPAMSVEDYVNKFAAVRIDAVNHALKGIPEDRIRYHLCWGSWHGPHAYDLEMKDFVDVMLAVKAGAYSFEAANARHEHEYAVWESTKLPAGKLVLPGIITHSTDVIEHPELVAQRIIRFAKVVGKENVIASADCGFGGRSHPQIAWAKLKALGDGAAIATKALGY